MAYTQIIHRHRHQLPILYPFLSSSFLVCLVVWWWWIGGYVDNALPGK